MLLADAFVGIEWTCWSKSVLAVPMWTLRT